MKKHKVSGHKEAHTANVKHGMGDYYGSGLRAKVGKIRSVYEPGANPVSPKMLKKPPKTLA
jgi:hypothetical protein